MKSLLYKYLYLLALMAYIVSFLISAKVLVPQASLSKFDKDGIKICEVSNNAADSSCPPVDNDDDDSTDNTEYCAGGCKYLLGFTFDCLKGEYYSFTNFHWKFHYQSPHEEILCDPPRAFIS